MVCYSLDVRGWKPALAVVAAHGMTDLHSTDWMDHYLGWLLVPMPSTVLTCLFCASSVVHFAADGGIYVSAAAHAVVLAIGMRRGPNVAFKAMLTYLVAWHTPNHYARHIRGGRWRGVAIAAAQTAVALLACRRLPNQFVLTNWMQRIVIAHISHELEISMQRGPLGQRQPAQS